MKKSLKLFCFLLFPFFVSAQNYFAPLGGPAGVSGKSSFKDANGVLYVKTDGADKYLKSFDDGATWLQIMINDNTQIERLYADEIPNLYATDENGVLYKSDENGSVWNAIFFSDFTTSKNWLSISPSGNLYYSTKGELYLSSDKGVTWDTLFNDKPVWYEMEFHFNGDIYGVSFVSVEYILVRSVDGGTQWEEVFAPIAPVSDGVHKFHISKSGNIYVKTETGDAAPIARYECSYDNGDNFEIFTDYTSYYSGLATNDTESILLHDYSTLLFSAEMGQNWQSIKAGLPDLFLINHIYIDNDQFIYLSLQNNVLYKSVVPSTQITLTDEAKNENVFSFDIYPNPANDLLKFQMRSDLPSNGGDFSVVDVNGKVIREIKSFMPKETHTVPVHDWSAGVYFLQYLVDGLVRHAERFVIYK